MSTAPRRKLSALFSRDDIATLTERSDWAGARAVLFTWGVVALCFALLAWRPHPLMWLAVLVVLGGRQLSLAILMHDAAHGTLFRRRWLNEVLADWLCGSPVGVDIQRYKRHHLVHHGKTGTGEDPDRSLSAPFPASTRAPSPAPTCCATRAPPGPAWWRAPRWRRCA